MIRLSMIDIYKLFGALVEHGYRIELEDCTMIYDIIDNADATEFTIDGVTYKANDKLYVKIYKPLTEKAITSLIISLL